jgi:hypothetical protein
MIRPVADVDEPAVAAARESETLNQASHAPQKRRPSRAIIVSLIAVLIAAVAGAGLWLRHGGDEFAVAEPTTGYKLFPMDPGKTEFFLGGLYLRQPGREVEIRDVKVLSSPNVEYLGAFTIWPRDYSANKLVVGPGFPPSELKDRHPALGVKVPAAETGFMPADWSRPEPPPLTVAVGFRVTSGDVGAVNGVRVVYTVNGTIKHEDFHHAVIACVKPNTCKAPDGRISSEYNDEVLRRFGLLPEE